MTNQYAALLTVALTHDAMVRALHEQEAPAASGEPARLA